MVYTTYNNGELGEWFISVFTHIIINRGLRNWVNFIPLWQIMTGDVKFITVSLMDIPQAQLRVVIFHAELKNCAGRIRTNHLRDELQQFTSLR